MHPQISSREVRLNCDNFTRLLLSQSSEVSLCNLGCCNLLIQELLVRQHFTLPWWMIIWMQLWLWWTEPLNSSMSPWPPSSSKVNMHTLTDWQTKKKHEHFMINLENLRDSYQTDGTSHNKENKLRNLIQLIFHLARSMKSIKIQVTFCFKKFCTKHKGAKVCVCLWNQE